MCNNLIYIFPLKANTIPNVQSAFFISTLLTPPLPITSRCKNNKHMGADDLGIHFVNKAKSSLGDFVSTLVKQLILSNSVGPIVTNTPWFSAKNDTSE